MNELIRCPVEIMPMLKTINNRACAGGNEDCHMYLHKESEATQDHRVKNHHSNAY